MDLSSKSIKYMMCSKALELVFAIMCVGGENERRVIMTTEVNSINSTSATSSTSSTSSSNTASNALTDETKAKLLALGVDVSNIKTEMQGEIALQQAQRQQKTQETAKNSQEDSVKSEALSLASEVGASVSSDATTSDIMSAISAKISELQSSAGADVSKMQQVAEYQQQYDSLSTSIASQQMQQAQMASSMNGLANYNKIFQNI